MPCYRQLSSYNLAMALFTAVLELAGGTYISQVHAATVHDALAEYSAQLLTNDAVGTMTMREALANALTADTPIEITGVKNVWCCSALVAQESALLNIIRTAE